MSRYDSSAAVLLFLLWMLELASTKDAEVTCLFQEDCMLPCRFLRGGMVIHWYKQQIPVHSYYYQKDQLRLQNKHFSGRTHLFNALVSHGNASLLLRRVKVQDQGRYKCFTSTRKDSQETFINLHVKAPIPLVRMEMTNESVTCMSQNIYPAPEVLWSTDPPVAPCALVNSTRKTPDSRGLFSIESRVGIVGNVSDFTYFCSVRSADGSQEWTASRRKQDDLFGESGRSLLIPCITPQPNQNFTLSWSFNRGRNPITLLTYDSRTRQTSGSTWQGRVELDQEQVLLGNGSLRLLNPESGENTGSYTCTLSAFQTKHVVQVWVNVTDRSADEGQRVCKRSWWGTAASVCVFVLTMVAGVLRCFRMGGGAHGHVNGGKVVKLCMSQIDIPILDLTGGDANRVDGSSGPNDRNGARLHETTAESHVSHDSDDFQRHPIPEGDITEIEELGIGSDAMMAEVLIGSDVITALTLEADLPTPASPEYVTGICSRPGNEHVLESPIDEDGSPIPMQAGGGSESNPQVDGNGVVMMTATTGTESAMPGHVMVIHCEPERPPKDQMQGLGSANSDSYFLKLALFPSSHKDLTSSIAPNKLEGDENVFIVPEQFQIHGLR